MSYCINPLTDEEIVSLSLMDAGDYDFQVIKSQDKISNNGNRMNVVDLKFWDKEGKTYTMRDWIVFSEHPLCLRKVKHWCDSTGLQEEYNKGELREDFTGLCGRATVGVKEPEKNPEGGLYPRKNFIVDYIVGGTREAPINNSFDDRDLPF